METQESKDPKERLATLARSETEALRAPEDSLAYRGAPAHQDRVACRETEAPPESEDLRGQRVKNPATHTSDRSA